MLDPNAAADADYNERAPMRRVPQETSRRWLVEYMWMWLACLEDELDIARCLTVARERIEAAIEMMNPGDPGRRGCERALAALPLATRTLFDDGKRPRAVRLERGRRISVRHEWMKLTLDVLSAAEVATILGMRGGDRDGRLKAVRERRRRARR